MDDITESRWRVLPLGRRATLGPAALEAVRFGLVGLLALFVVALVTGIFIDAVFAETEVGIVADVVLRASVGGVILFALIGALALGMLFTLVGWLTVRALAAAVRHDTPATHVPSPEQWGTATTGAAAFYKLAAVVVLVILALPYLILVFVVLGDPDPAGLAVLGGGALLLAGIWSGIPLAERVVEPRQLATAAELQDWWTQAHRDRAFERALTEEEVSEARARAGLIDRLPGRRLRTLKGLLATVVGLGVVAWGVAFQVMAAIAYPDRESGPGGRLGERADLDPADERWVDLLDVAGGIGAVIGLVAFAGMVACEIIIWRVERRELRRALADGDVAPPPYVLLRRAMDTACPPALRLVFALAAATLAVGFGLWFATLVADRPDWDAYAAAGPQLRDSASLGPWMMLGSVMVMGLGVVLGSQLDIWSQPLRDSLVQRWPVRSEEREDEASDSTDEATADTEEKASG